MAKARRPRDLIKVLSKSANDPNDSKRDTAKELLRLLDAFLDDEDHAEASDDLTDEEIEDAVSGRRKGASSAVSHGRAKALAASPKATNLSGYGAELDRQMGLNTQSRGPRVEGSMLVLSSAGRGPR